MQRVRSWFIGANICVTDEKLVLYCKSFPTVVNDYQFFGQGKHREFKEFITNTNE